MVRHPLDENLDKALGDAKDVLEAETDLDVMVDVGDIYATGENISVTVTIDGSGPTEDYVVTVRSGGNETELRTPDSEEMLAALVPMVAHPGVQIHDTAEDSIAVLKGHMDIYIFDFQDRQLRYNGPVNATARTISEVPEEVRSFVKEFAQSEIVGDVNE